MSPVEAVKTQGKIRKIYITKLKYPYLKYDLYVREPTLQLPSQLLENQYILPVSLEGVVNFNLHTGKVLYESRRPKS